MTLREEILMHSGLLEESNVGDEAMAALKSFRKSLEQHNFLYDFENKAVDAIENNQKSNVDAFIIEAKQYMKFLGGIVQLINQEQKAISDSIENANKEINK